MGYLAGYRNRGVRMTPDLSPTEGNRTGVAERPTGGQLAA